MTGILLGCALVAGATSGWRAVILAIAITSISFLLSGGRARWTVALIVFALIGCLRVHDRPHVSAPDWVGDDLLLTGRIVSGPVESGKTQFFEINALSVAESSSAKLCARAPLLPVVHFGDLLWVSGSSVSIVDLNRNDSGYLRSRGCAGSLDIDRFEVRERGSGVRAQLDILRRELTTALQTAAPGDTGALMAGLVTGDDAGLSYEKRRAFIVTGTSHITAVSGSNLAVVVSLFTFAGTAIGRGKRLWWQGLVVSTLWLYVAVIGFSPPPVRAAVVATLALLAVRFGRKPDFITLSLAAAAVELIARPADFDSLAFRLSTISAIALVLGLSQRSPKGIWGWLTHIVIGTAATTAATSILLIPIFGRFAVYAIPANVVVATFCSFAFPIAFVVGLAGLFSQSLADAIAAPATIPTRFALWSVEWIANLPYADAGAAIVGALPVWTWTVICVAIVIGLSRECRGGIVRLGNDLASLDSRMQTVIGTSAVGGVAGLVLGLWLR